MILCSRCDFVGHVTGLLEHWDAVHGGWSVRYPDEKPMTPDGTRIEEWLAIRRTQNARYRAKRRAS